MATFSSTRRFYRAASFSDKISQNIIKDFRDNGFTVIEKSLLSGGWNISVSKGNMFKAVLGMKTALNIDIQIRENDLIIEAGVGIYGQQAIPSAISMLLFWPVLITQIWGMVQQSKLDERVMELAESTLANINSIISNFPEQQSEIFCPNCGTKISENMKFCGECGSKL